MLVQAFGQEEELIEASVNQKIVLLGNNLKDDNLVVWNKIVALAVKYISLAYLIYKNLNLYDITDRVVQELPNLESSPPLTW